MKAMLLAAGRGLRMRSLTENVPKPLLKINNTTLIEHNLVQLKRAGINEVVINVCYLANQIMDALGDGHRYGLKIQYANEQEKLLDTGGGIKNALPMLGDSPFLLLSSDIWTDYPFEKLLSRHVNGAHLVLVDNPKYHETGDFSLVNGQVAIEDSNPLTFASIAILDPSLFSKQDQIVFPISKVFREAIQSQVVTGEHYPGVWFNVGTPEELLHAQAIDQQLAGSFASQKFK